MSTSEHEAQTTTGDEAVPSAPELETPRTRTGAAWMAAATGALLVLLMLVFILQNSQKVQMDFLWTDFSLPLGVGLLLAAVLGALIVLALGIGRLLQLRLAARRHRKADRQAAAMTASRA